MVFFRPEWLLLALALPLLLAYRLRKGEDYFTWGISDVGLLKHRLGGWFERLFFTYQYFYLIPLAAVIAGLGEPHLVERSERVWGPGVDIAVAVDISGSMAKRDFKPDRLSFARRIFFEGISPVRQYDDRFGLIIFASKAYTLCPLTDDWEAFRKMFESVSVGEIGDRTAIGDAIGAALARLRSSRRKRAIILITDGENNAGELNPLRAAQIARAFGVPIYTVFLGKEKGAVGKGDISPTLLLEKVSTISGGKSFRVESGVELGSLIKKIPRSIVPERGRGEVELLRSYRDVSHLFVGVGLATAVILFFLQVFVFRTYYRGV